MLKITTVNVSQAHDHLSILENLQTYILIIKYKNSLPHKISLNFFTLKYKFTV